MMISSGFFITYLEKQAITKEPENLYEPSPTYGNRWKAHSSSSNLMTTEVLMEIIKALPWQLRFSIIFL
jgi:hypothetical protein